MIFGLPMVKIYLQLLLLGSISGMKIILHFGFIISKKVYGMIIQLNSTSNFNAKSINGNKINTKGLLWSVWSLCRTNRTNRCWASGRIYESVLKMVPPNYKCSDWIMATYRYKGKKWYILHHQSPWLKAIKSFLHLIIMFIKKSILTDI